MARVLIIDDDEIMCDALSSLVKQMGYAAANAFTLEESLKKVSSEAFDIVFLDVGMPDGNGLDILPRIREAPSSPEVIIITASGDPDGAELAIRIGAWDYIEKTSSIKEMMLSLVRALQYRREKTVSKRRVALKREGILGDSPKMKDCFDLLAQAASTDANVLVTGETGTGKELFARAIHDNSFRAGKNFVVVDCSALPETLVESVLFGHQKGAFTGADKAEAGLISQADGGTLFLDEVGELPLGVQKTFLRVLQEHRFRPVGGKHEKESQFRLVAATNRDLDKMKHRKKFREDLLYRLRSLTIELPPLRERGEDVRALAMCYTARLCERYRFEIKGFSPEFFAALAAYDWPGNVRELFNTLQGAITVAGHEPTLFPKHLPTHMRIQMARASVGKHTPVEAPQSAGIKPANTIPGLKDFRASMEKQYLSDLLTMTNGNIKRAIQISDLSQSRFYTLLKKYKLLTLKAPWHVPSSSHS